ncbi:AP180 N-terminal ANTH domain-containing protein [Cinnamomum micranthum f. kanehirae]|uniref:AP180 N-terminal ANTH domain-containing protein n=1 Tax=Cinnamomum micranthum f. kanehirae TaxID=337451 RepID=A0A443PKK9_9MAGN|nr:AP180 N-terminal ANTH domain-containing protein [Cinnamomum micranthum f. kanehirae]
MASASSTQQSFRKALGALKDSTKVGLAKVNSDYKELDIALVKATNHDERMPKEKHVRTIFDATSAARPRADVAYCIQAIAKRLAKTHNWAVALKTLMIIHRALREVDPTFREELINFTRNRGHMLNLSHFRDDSSPNAWDYSAWVRTYALYLEERLECFRILNYDAGTERSGTRELNTVDLLEQLPALQQLLFRLLDCQPESAAVYNNLIQCALSIIAGESVRIYSAINDGTLNLVDKFFEMKRNDAIRALEIYRKAGHQAERLSEFYEICNGLDLLRRQKFIKIEQPPASFVTAMEEYVKEAPLAPSVQRNLGNDDRGAIPKVIMAIEQKKSPDIEENPKASDVPPEPPKNDVSVAQEASPSTDDLLGLNEFKEEASELDQKNALALAIATTESPSNIANGLDPTSGASGWELALVTAPSSNGSAVTESKLAGGLDRLTLDSLYDNAMVKPTNQNGSYHMGQVSPNPFESAQYPQDPFYLSNNMAPPTNVQMAAMAQQQAFMMQQQQQLQLQLQLMGSTNPFANPYEGEGIPSTHPSHNPNTSLI